MSENVLKTKDQNKTENKKNNSVPPGVTIT